MNRKQLQKIAIATVFIISSYVASAQNGMSVNSTGIPADASAMLDVNSTTRGMLIPRMTTLQRDHISAPATGLMIYQTDGTVGYYFYNGSVWAPMAGGALSISGAAPINYNSGTSTISITKANTSTNGYLSFADWNTFNNKLTPNTAIAAGTNTKITYDVNGLVTGGTTPTTFAGYSIADNSAGLAGAISDGTGTGAVVFANSPALTGSPTAPTQTSADNSTNIATTAFVTSAVGAATGTTSSVWNIAGNAPGAAATLGTTDNSDVNFQTGAGTLNISNDAATTTVNVGTGAGAKTVTLGSTNGASATTVQSGTNGVTVAAANGNVAINSGTGGMFISTDNTDNNVFIGTGLGTKFVTIGSTQSTSGTTIQSGTQGISMNSNNGSTTLVAGMGSINIGTDNTASPVNIGNGLGTKTVTLGNANSVSSTTILSGTGGIALNSGSGPVSLGNAASTVGFFDATPVSQQTGDISAALNSFGLVTSGTLPVGSLSGLGTGVATFLATPSSANLASALTDETGSASGGLAVFNNTPTINTPQISAGLTATGSASNDFSGSTGAFKTSSGANTLSGPASGSSLALTSFLNEAQGADIVSSLLTNIGTATGNYVNVTGSSTITFLGPAQAGTRRIVQFSGVLTITNSANILLPGAANITTAIGDVGTFVCLGGGAWKCVDYLRQVPNIGASAGTSLTLSSFLNEAQGADIASSGLTDIGAATGNYVNVTGSSTITFLGTAQAGTRRIVQFSGVLTITNSANILLPGAANIITTSGDVLTFVSLGSGAWKCVDYLRQVLNIGASAGTSLTLSSFLNEAQGADIVSSALTNIGTATGNYVNVTGSSTITFLGTAQAGTRRIVQFSGVLTITNSANILLPGATNITTTIGDVGTFVCLGGGAWKCVDYLRASGGVVSGVVAVANGGTGTGTAGIGAFNNITGLTALGTTGTTSTNLVFSSNATLVTPNLGTPSAIILTNGTLLPLSTGVTGTLAIANGGTGNTSLITAPTASTIVGQDANKNYSANSVIEGYTTTPTAAGTTTLAVGSSKQQYFTGVTTQAVTLPLPSTLVTGQQFIITNNSTGLVTVNAAAAQLVQTMTAGTTAIITCTTAGTAISANWAVEYSSNTGGIAGTVAVANGGTGNSSLITAPTANTIVGQDANKNYSANSFLEGQLSPASGAGATLTNTSAEQTILTGAAQTVTLPTTAVIGQQFKVYNTGTAVGTINASGGAKVDSMVPNTNAIFTALSTTPTAPANWAVMSSGGTLIGIRTFTTVGAGTYVPSSGTTSIYIILVGAGGQGGGNPATSFLAGGGGGAGAVLYKYITGVGITATSGTFSIGTGGSTSGTNTTGQAGTASTFTWNGTTFTANPGGGGAVSVNNGTVYFCPGGIGGGPSTGDFVTGGAPGGNGLSFAAQAAVSGCGGSTPFGGGGSPSNITGTGNNGTGFGSGGAGSMNSNGSAQKGGTGANGLCIIYEYH